MTWQIFVHRASALRYPTVKDASGQTIVGIHGGYIAEATDGPAGPRVNLVSGVLDVLYDTPAEKDVEAFLKRVAAR
jgi:hypothetical protein